MEGHLSQARQRLGERSGLAPESLDSLLAPVAVTTEFQSGNDGRSARIAAFVAVGLVLYGVFTSMAYMMVSVTAEKQLRVTGGDFRDITQTWIDGKIIGISAVALVNVLIFLAALPSGYSADRLRRHLFHGSRRACGDSVDRSVRAAGLRVWLSLSEQCGDHRRSEHIDTRTVDVPSSIFSVAGMMVPSIPTRHSRESPACSSDVSSGDAGACRSG